MAKARITPENLRAMVRGAKKVAKQVGSRHRVRERFVDLLVNQSFELDWKESPYRALAKIGRKKKS